MSFEDTIRRVISANQDARARHQRVSSRVVAAIISGSEETLDDILTELAGELGQVLQGAGEDAEPSGADSSAGSAGPGQTEPEGQGSGI